MGFLDSAFQEIADIGKTTDTIITAVKTNPNLTKLRDNAPYSGGRKMGGFDIRNIQFVMTNLGYNTYGVDGVYGTNSKNAVRAFQKDNGLYADGIFGSNTAKAVVNKLMPIRTMGGNMNSWIIAFGGTIPAAVTPAEPKIIPLNPPPPEPTPYIPSQPSPVAPKPKPIVDEEETSPDPVPTKSNSMIYLITAAASFGVIMMLRKKKK
ncbi:MAG: peptidoglycan-binding protein [Leptospiraceae bacterium]|nr:peptidoglycan-binding protein [Leptospiraceae bacterium]